MARAHSDENSDSSCYRSGSTSAIGAIFSPISDRSHCSHCRPAFCLPTPLHSSLTFTPAIFSVSMIQSFHMARHKLCVTVFFLPLLPQLSSRSISLSASYLRPCLCFLALIFLSDPFLFHNILPLREKQLRREPQLKLFYQVPFHRQPNIFYDLFYQRAAIFTLTLKQSALSHSNCRHPSTNDSRSHFEFVSIFVFSWPESSSSTMGHPFSRLSLHFRLIPKGLNMLPLWLCELQTKKHISFHMTRNNWPFRNRKQTNFWRSCEYKSVHT